MATHATEIYLVRHGETTLTNAKQYVGATDIPLSEHGRTQAQRLSEKLRDTHFDACYCSPLGRCRETAQIIAAPHQLALNIVDALREIDYGKWELLTVSEMKALRPDIYVEWERDPANVQAPEGESGDEVLARIRPAFDALAAAHPGQRILIVAHRTVNRIWLCHLLGHPIAAYRSAVGQDLTALNVLRYDPEVAPHFSVVLMNDTTHLNVNTRH
ncbi:phosphoglycerate mutase [Candidatus Moduliflexus flocculans]|uniref:Phosphoglycerate mutase n=1 Tax=Candidatus Moduliflexus flocculans TaxID=1499966 RepID=A0A0S6VWB2_9BACT|nr:phosphoglycerate mutase [Candidatus Moduliflexus flocculans]